MLHREDRESLLIEYQILQNEVSRRSTINLMVSSVLLPSSVIIVAIAIEFKERINMIFPFGINVAGFFPLFSALLILASWFFSYMANRINEICFKRMNEIEITLGIKGHRHIYYRTKRAWYYRA